MPTRIGPPPKVGASSVRRPEQLDFFRSPKPRGLPGLQGKNIVFFDLETTGKDRQFGHETFELTLLRCDSAGKELGRYDGSIRVTKRVSYGAFRTHGKNNPDISGDSAEEVFPKLRSFIGEDDIVAGFNIRKFDVPFINSHLVKLGLSPLKNKLIDVYEIVRNEFKNIEGYGLDSHKQEDVARYLGIETGTSHQAGDDAKTVKELLFKLAEKRPDEVRQYLSFLSPCPILLEDKQLSFGDRFDRERKAVMLRQGLGKLEMMVEGDYLKHEYLKSNQVLVNVEQLSAAAKALEGSTLIGMSTGLGKTVIVLLMAAYLKKKGAGKTILLAPHLEIIDDHKKDFERLIQGMKLGILTGLTRKTHEQAIAESDLLMGTPETIYRLNSEGKIPWKEVALLVVDEGHKIKEKYYGRGIVSAYKGNREKPLITALTATIGEEFEEVKKMLEDFGIPLSRSSIILKDKEEVAFPFQTEEEKIVCKSLNTQTLQYILKEAMVAEMDHLRRNDGFLKEHLPVKACLDKMEKLRETGKWDWDTLREVLRQYFSEKYESKDLAKKRAEAIVEKLKAAKKEERQTIFKWEIYVPILAEYVQNSYQSRMKENENFSCMKAAGKVGSLRHLLSHITSDHLLEAHLAAQRIRKKDTRGAQELCEDRKINLLFEILELIASWKDGRSLERWQKLLASLELPPIEELARDPRLEEIVRMVKDYRLPGEKVLILTDLRDTVEKIANQLQKLGLPVARVWGTQNGETQGMTAKAKKGEVEAFREGKIEILVSTKFLGLGVNLDFDNLVIENLSVDPKEWKQMGGRVGRTREGHVYYLVGDNDAEKARERQLMYRLRKMRETRKFFKT